MHRPSLLQRFIAVLLALLAILTWLTSKIFLWFASPLFIIAIVALLLQRKWKKAFSLFFVAIILIASWTLGLNKIMFALATLLLISSAIAFFIPLKLPAIFKKNLSSNRVKPLP